MGSDDKASSAFDQELRDIARLESEKEQLKADVEAQRRKLAEQQSSYFSDGKSLATCIVDVSKVANVLTRGSLNVVFRQLQQQYVKLVGGEDDNSSSNSDKEGSEDGDEPSPPAGKTAVRGAVAPRFERSDSTIGWLRARPRSGTGEMLNLLAPAQQKALEEMTSRFQSLVNTLEAALYLDRPMDGVQEAIKEKNRRLQSEIEELRNQLDSTKSLLEEEGAHASEVRTNLELAKALMQTFTKLSEGAGAEQVRKWMTNEEATKETLDSVAQLTTAKLQRTQRYHHVIGREYMAPRDAMELGEDGSMLACRADVLFEMLVSGEGASKFADFDNVFLYGFRSWIKPVSLLERFIEVFCTTPEDIKSASERSKISAARHRVLRLLGAWVDMHEYDAQEKGFSARMQTFLDTASIAGFDEDCKKLRAKLTGNFFYDDDRFDQPYPAPIVPADLKSFTFLDLDPLEVARQLTLQDAALFQGLQTRELLDCQWSKVSTKKKRRRAESRQS